MAAAKKLPEDEIALVGLLIPLMLTKHYQIPTERLPR